MHWWGNGECWPGDRRSHPGDNQAWVCASHCDHHRTPHPHNPWQRPRVGYAQWPRCWVWPAWSSTRQPKQSFLRTCTWPVSIHSSNGVVSACTFHYYLHDTKTTSVCVVHWWGDGECRLSDRPSLILEVIKFAHHMVMIMAHRIHTIFDNDRVLVCTTATTLSLTHPEFYSTTQTVLIQWRSKLLHTGYFRLFCYSTVHREGLTEFFFVFWILY